MNLVVSILMQWLCWSTTRSFQFDTAVGHNRRQILPFRAGPSVHRLLPREKCRLFADKDSSNDKSRKEDYRSPITEFLSNFMTKSKQSAKSEEDPLIDINFGASKLQQKLDLDKLACVLDSELYHSEWFVTGKVNPIYFSESFVFQDPDVKLQGIEAYARGVNKLFDQECSRAEIISTVVNPEMPNTITCTWRLSGKADIGPGLVIKPYIVYSDFTVDADSGLIVFQEDRFALPSWDILLSSLFPFLIGTLTAAPAPPVQARNVPLPAEVLKGVTAASQTPSSPWDALQNIFKAK